MEFVDGSWFHVAVDDDCDRVVERRVDYGVCEGGYGCSCVRVGVGGRSTEESNGYGEIVMY